MRAPSRDADVVEAQLGRPARGLVGVVRRCALGLPVVVEVAPVLESGEPFPTRYWLTCKLLHRRVARLEAEGGVVSAQRALDEDPALRARLDAAHARYAADRDALVPEGVLHAPAGGVGGSRGGVKCLHAHLADGLAGQDNPIFERIEASVCPAECDAPCVQETDTAAVPNRAWREPRAG